MNEHIDDIVDDALDRLCLTVADAAHRLGISRSTIYRDIKRGKLNAVTREDGVRGIEIAELQRAYDDGTDRKAAPASKPSSEADGDRITQLEAALLRSNERIKILEAQFAATEENEALRTQQPAKAPGPGSRPQKPSDARYYPRKRRRKATKLLDRSLYFIGVASLLIAVTGIVIGIVYTIDRWNQQSGWTQSSTY